MNKIEVGKRIKAFMKEKALTQNDVASVFGLVQSNVSEMINGKRDTLKLAEMISDKYNVSLDWLIYGDNISIQDINIPNTDTCADNSVQQELETLKNENASLKKELDRLKALKLPTKDSKVYNLWMKFMEITCEWQEMYEEEKRE